MALEISITSSKIILFLDDTNILVIVENENTLEHKINRVMNELQLWFGSKS
jgi:hypothetical protein